MRSRQQRLPGVAFRTPNNAREASVAQHRESHYIFLEQPPPGEFLIGIKCLVSYGTKEQPWILKSRLLAPTAALGAINQMVHYVSTLEYVKILK